jgi:hypothetical protein
VKRHVRLAVIASATLALLVAACSGGPDLSAHAELHAFADEVCEDLRLASPAPETMIADVIARGIEGGATRESVLEILNEECPGTLTTIDASAG